MGTLALVVITAETFWDGEGAVLNKLFERGMTALHLRKPLASEENLRHLLSRIHAAFHDRIMLHDGFALTGVFRLKGVHLNRRNPVPPQQTVNFLSRSCHSLAELEQIDGFSYVFLSPVFDSISKKGYTQAFTNEDLRAAKAKGLINEKVIALGGIHASTLPLALTYGFGGVAVLGALWGDFLKTKDEHALMKRFDELRTMTQKQ